MYHFLIALFEIHATKINVQYTKAVRKQHKMITTQHQLILTLLHIFWKADVNVMVLVLVDEGN